jgi:hypothetical protein
MKLLAGIVVGFLLATIGVGGIINLINKGISEVQSQAQSTSGQPVDLKIPVPSFTR